MSLMTGVYGGSRSTQRRLNPSSMCSGLGVLVHRMKEHCPSNPMECFELVQDTALFLLLLCFSFYED